MAEEAWAVRTSEAARMLGVSSRQTVISMVDDDLLRVHRTKGGHRRVERASVVELLEALSNTDPQQRQAQLDGIRRRNRGEDEPKPPAG